MTDIHYEDLSGNGKGVVDLDIEKQMMFRTGDRLFADDFILPSDGVDSRPGIQRAIKFCNDNGITKLYFAKPLYYLNRNPKTVTLPDNKVEYAIRLDLEQTGMWLVSEKTIELITTCGFTMLQRRASDGSPITAADHQVTEYGYCWRGGGIYMVGQSVDPGDPSVGSLTLDGVGIHGGLPNTGNHDWYSGDPDGWDITDKGIWQQNDHYCGHITMKNGAQVIGFRGELIYTSGIAPTWAERFLRIDASCVIGESNGSCLNPQGITTQIERCLCYDAVIGVEGWTGKQGGYLKAHFRDCASMTIQGGVPFVATPELAGSYYTPSRPPSGELPIGEIDIIIENMTNCAVGSWIRGKITSIDSTVSLGLPAGGIIDTSEVQLEITDYVDKKSKTSSVSLLGGMSNTQLLVHIKRTKHAEANNFSVSSTFYGYGFFGKNNFITIGDYDYPPEALIYTGPISGAPINFRNWPVADSAAPVYHAVDSATLVPYIAPWIWLSGAAGSYTLTLPTVDLTHGAELLLTVLPGLNLTMGNVQGSPVLSGNYRTHKFVFVNVGTSPWVQIF